MTFTQFLLILKARWRLILILGSAGLVLAVMAVLLLPPNYTADADVLVNVRTPQTVQITGDPGVTPQIQPDYVSTQVDVIKSARVALEAVKRLGITSDPESMKDYRDSGSSATPEAYFADQIGRKLKVIPSTTSRVIAITYTARNAAGAAAYANAFAEAYQAVAVELQRDPERQSSGFYAQSVADLGKKLAEAQAKLSARRSELGVTELPDGTDAEDARLSALSQQLATAQATQALQNARTGEGALPDATNNPVVQGLQADIARLEGQRHQLATFAGPNNVDYQQLTNQITALRTELTRQQGEIAHSSVASSSQANASVASLQKAVEAQRARVIASQRDRGEIAALEQDVTNLKATYQQVVARQAQSGLLADSEQTNVTLLSPATPPVQPAGLPAALKVVAGLVLGLAIGLVAALVLEFLDQRMRSPDDAAVWLEIPNLGGVRALEGPGPRRLAYSPLRYLPRYNGDHS